VVVAGRKKNTVVVVVAPSSLFSLIANKGGVNVFRKESLNARFKTFLQTKVGTKIASEKNAHAVCVITKFLPLEP